MPCIQQCSRNGCRESLQALEEEERGNKLSFEKKMLTFSKSFTVCLQQILMHQISCLLHQNTKNIDAALLPAYRRWLESHKMRFFVSHFEARERTPMAWLIFKIWIIRIFTRKCSTPTRDEREKLQLARLLCAVFVLIAMRFQRVYEINFEYFSRITGVSQIFICERFALRLCWATMTVAAQNVIEWTEHTK